MSLYDGLPLPVQILFWAALALVCATFLTIAVLQLFALRARRFHFHPADEADFLWVFFVPALNEEVTIADSVARLAQCQATHKIIMAIDDGSDDATQSILQSMDIEELQLLRRELPDARVGKAAALNAAWSRLHELLRTPQYAQWPAKRVIVVVIDADGRLAPTAPQCFARHFIDPRTGGVQSLVRIYNRRGWLTWAQDVEFSVFGWVYQLGRSFVGTANMGGNGQANRLAALDSVAEGAGPWRDRLTEDQDIGVRFLKQGWNGRQDIDCVVEQQGVSDLRRLYRQRTRWAQGGWESLHLIGAVRTFQASFFARVDHVLYLLQPVIQTIVALTLATAAGIAIIAEVAFFSGATLTVAFFVVVSLGPGLLGLLSRGRGLTGLLTAVVLLLPYTLYSWLIFPVVIRAGVRALAGRTGWEKTAREPLAVEAPAE